MADGKESVSKIKGSSYKYLSLRLFTSGRPVHSNTKSTSLGSIQPRCKYYTKTIHSFTVVPALKGHFCIQAKVSLHGRCPLIGGTGMLEWRVQCYTYMVDMCG